MRQINDKGMAIIKYFESCKLEMYVCEGGKKTIGWGHVLDDDTPDGFRVSQSIADAWLEEDIHKFEKDVESLVKVPITDNQFSALVSLCFNIGPDIDADNIVEGLGDSQLLKYVNAEEFLLAANEFPKWRRAKGKILKGLVRRRAAERSLFLET
jgi:lysozyme